ncbi:hypothetical protein BDC45DRAFT_606323 [Circinella umbellata]|nr:hypothetical protein BDC45DRAFT_606323 [Circinella umbellata]
MLFQCKHAMAKLIFFFRNLSDMLRSNFCLILFLLLKYSLYNHPASNMSDKSKRYEAICSQLRCMKENGPVLFQFVIDAMETEIVQSSLIFGLNFDYKATWIKDIQSCANDLDIQLDNAKPTWKRIENKLHNKRQGNTSAPVKPSTPSPVASSSSTCSTLKTKLSTTDRDKAPWSVERKMREFVATLSYIHPSLSFILDTNDLNWVDYFSKEELEEIKSSGQPILRHIPDELKPKFEQIEKLKSALDAYNFGRLIDHHPIEQPLLTWLFQTLVQTAPFFIPGACTSTQNMLESDKLYYLWNFLNTIYRNSGIEALGKEKTSTTHAKTLNSKRKLSAADVIEREKIGRRLDTIYIGDGIELGGLETGSRKDNTKEFEDSMLKLPIVFKDMLTEIVSHRPSLLHKAHVIGYNINGNAVRLIDADVPGGHIVRIRRTDELEYPTNSDGYALKMVSLLELASYGKAIIDDTYALCCQTRVPPSAGGMPSLLPRSTKNRAP